MKTLVVFYSRTGFTRKVAELVAAGLGADIEEIKDPTDRRGVKGFIRSGKEARTGLLPPIEPPEHDPGQYELVVIGTPMWAFTMSSPARAYLTVNKDRLGKSAFFCTTGGTDTTRTFEHMRAITGREPVAVLGLSAREFRNEVYKVKTEEFVHAIQGRLQQ